MVSIDADRVQLWLRRGARPSDSARQLLVKEGILAARPFKITPRPEPAEPEAPAKAAANNTVAAEPTPEAAKETSATAAASERAAADEPAVAEPVVDELPHSPANEEESAVSVASAPRRGGWRRGGQPGRARSAAGRGPRGDRTRRRGGEGREMTDYADLTRFIAERIVSKPAAVTVDSRPRGRSTIVTLNVAEEDMGKLIGKTGRNIEAVRAVVRAAGLRHHQRVQVELKDIR